MESSSRNPSQLKSKSYDPVERRLLTNFPVNPMLFKPFEFERSKLNPPLDPEALDSEALDPETLDPKALDPEVLDPLAVYS